MASNAEEATMKKTTDTNVEVIIEKASGEGIKTVWDRYKAMQPQCGFGDLGLCCRICNQGPCRINPYGGEPREGICGAKDYTIVARNLIRMIAAGCAAHSDHGRHIAHTLHLVAEGKTNDYSIKDEAKLHAVAQKIGVSTEGRSKEEIAKDVAEFALNDFSKHDRGTPTWLKAGLTAKRLEKLERYDVIPGNIDGTITEVMHRTHMGVDAAPTPLIFGGIKCSLGDLDGEWLSSDLSDILFGTPKLIKSEANFGVMDESKVNIAVHGHNPVLSEVICDLSQELETEAKDAGATGINIVGMCCTGQEVLMRRGIPLVTSYASQDLAIATGAMDAVVFDYQCIMPSIDEVSQCYNTKAISTMPIARMANDTHIEFREESARADATKIVRLAIEAYKLRNPSRISIPDKKESLVAGFSVEAIMDMLKAVSPDDPMQYLVDKLKSGEIRGIAAMAGCNNVKITQDMGHITVARELIKNGVLVVATGCAANALSRAGIMSQEAADLAPEKLKAVLTELGEKAGLGGPIPPALGMGSCVDNSRIQDFATRIANKMGLDVSDLPVVASAAENMSEKAVAIGTWLVATGWPTHVGIIPYIAGSKLVMQIAEETARDVYGGYFIFEQNPEKAAQRLLNVIDERRWKIGLSDDTAQAYWNGYTPGEMAQKAPMSAKEIYQLAIAGGITATGYADILLNKAINTYGPQQEIGYPGTGYELPSFYGWSKQPVKKLDDLPALLGEVRAKLQHEPTYENALIAGEATMWSAEIVEALRYIGDETPYEKEAIEGIQEKCGFVPDTILRKLGIAFVDDTIPGCLVFVGKANDPKKLAEMVRDAQSKGMLLMASFDIIKQLQDEGIKMGTDIMLYPLGEFTQVIHGLNFAIRAALAFGGVERGDREALYNYLSQRPKVAVIQLGPLDQVKAAAEFAVLFHGSPTITDQAIEEIPDKYVSEPNYENIVQRAIEMRDMKIKLTKIPIPVSYGPAFEGESIRKADMFFEAGGTKTKAFELIRMRDADDVKDGEIKVIGKDLDDVEEGSRIPLGIVVDIYGRKMERDFESVFERRIHQFVNFGEGLWHTGQRNLIWIRMSKNAVKQGLRLKHIGDILHAKIHSEFEGVADRVQVTLITDEAEIDKLLPEAMKIYDERDERLRGLTDESAETFYSCTLCQSFAPSHVCIVTPERPGLCGAVNWLDAKAGYEIASTGPNQPWQKGEVINAETGEWVGINAAVKQLSRGKLDAFSCYSIIQNPMTSCGCFECIVAIVPEANGVMIVNREYGGDTPVGMRFSTLAGTVGGGNQTPGFIGVGRKYVTSKKFISADGGIRRLVWLPKMLKDAMADALKERAAEEGVPDLFDKIADETVATTPDQLLEYLEKVDHPALKMDPIM